MTHIINVTLLLGFCCGAAYLVGGWKLAISVPFLVGLICWGCYKLEEFWHEPH